MAELIRMIAKNGDEFWCSEEQLPVVLAEWGAVREGDTCSHCGAGSEAAVPVAQAEPEQPKRRGRPPQIRR